MLSQLPVISFLCVALLSVFLPVRCINASIVNLSLISWLIASNLIHGINSLVWVGNVDMHIPVWCDIVTRILLVANLALPASCLAISLDLERLSSKRTIVDNPRIAKARMLLDIMLCYILPILYMSLYFVAQDHRFSIMKDFGPMASIHPSTPALIMIWIPPLLVSIVTLLFSGLSLSHAFSHSYYNFRTHLSSRSSMTSSMFYRRVTFIIGVTLVIAVVNLFALFSPPRLVPWKSWHSVHEHSTEIKIITTQDEALGLKLTWWGIPVISFVYIFLSIALGEEARDSARWIAQSFASFKKWRSDRKAASILPTHSKRKGKLTIDTEMLEQVPSRDPLARKGVQLKSGWDDMLESAPKRTRSPYSDVIEPTIPSTSSSPSTTRSSEEDATFIASTLTYIGSPVAKSLGLRSPITPIMVSEPQILVESATPIDITFPSRCRQSIPEDAKSTISSIMNASWPEPPSSVSSGSSSRYSLYRSVTPPHVVPFEGSVVSTTAPLRTKSSNIRNWSVRTPPSDTIYMTVIQETVA
ncbi:pheromone A receptor-domain-containing protein [Mycena floridula]|nr:pheromone A receptor-domain-containing protein [Mycena floridula]